MTNENPDGSPLDRTRRDVIKGSAAMGALGLGSGVAAAGDSESSAKEPSGDVERIGPSDVETSTLSTASDVPDSVSFLVVKNCDPWWVAANEIVLDDMNVPYDVIDSNDLTRRDATDLESYSAIVLPSSQSQGYYADLVDARETLASFVSDGGTLVAHVTDSGWPCSARWHTSFLPQDVTHVTDYQNYLDTAADHPVVDGVSDGELDRWGYSAHGYLTNVPSSARTVVGYQGNPGARPTYVEYDHGDGRVLATTQTLEWSLRGYGATTEVLRNELRYAAVPRPPDSGGSLEETVGNKLERKSNLIDVIQANAGEVIGAGTAEAQLEENAEALHGYIEDNYQDAPTGTLQQYDEGVTRMLHAENVTSAAVEEPKPVIRKTMEKGVATAIQVIVEKVIDLGAQAVGGIQSIRRWVDGLNKSPISQANRLKRMILGFDMLPYSLRNRAVDILIDMENRLGDLLEGGQTRKDLIDMGKTAAGTGLSAAIDVGGDVVDDFLGVVDWAADELYELLYEMYLFSDTLPQVDYPVDVTWMEGVSQALQTSPSIDTACEKQMDQLHDAVEAGTLTSEDRQQREEFSEAAAGRIMTASDNAEALLESFENEIQAPIEYTELAIIGAAGVAYALDILAGGVTLFEIPVLITAGGVLIKVAGILGAIILLLLAAQALFGVLFFMVTNKIHAMATYGLVNYEAVFGA